MVTLLKTKEQGTGRLENLSTQDLIFMVTDLVVRVGKNPVITHLAGPDTTAHDDWVFETELEDGRKLSVDFYDDYNGGKWRNKTTEGATLKINLTPTNDSQFGIETYNNDLRELPNDFEVFLGLQSNSGKSFHFFPRIDTPGGSNVNMALTEKVGTQYRNLLILAAQTLQGK